MADKGILHPRTHRLLWVFMQSMAIVLVLLGVVTASAAGQESIGYQHGVGFFLALVGLLLERNHRRWLAVRWPPRCPDCGSVMDATTKLWEAPDDSPQRYVEYACRSCPMKYTNDVFGKAVFGWPPREPYEPPDREPFTIADGVKTVIALIVAVGIVAFLYWVGFVGNEP